MRPGCVALIVAAELSTSSGRAATMMEAVSCGATPMESVVAYGAMSARSCAPDPPSHALHAGARQSASQHAARYIARRVGGCMAVIEPAEAPRESVTVR